MKNGKIIIIYFSSILLFLSCSTIKSIFHNEVYILIKYNGSEQDKSWVPLVISNRKIIIKDEEFVTKHYVVDDKYMALFIEVLKAYPLNYINTPTIVNRPPVLIEQNISFEVTVFKNHKQYQCFILINHLQSIDFFSKLTATLEKHNSNNTVEIGLIKELNNDIEDIKYMYERGDRNYQK